MAVGELGGRGKSDHLVLTFVREMSGNFQVDLLCEPWKRCWTSCGVKSH